MRGLGLTVACVVLSVGAAAQAQTITAVGDSNGAITYDGPASLTSYHRDSDGNLIQGAEHVANGKNWQTGGTTLRPRFTPEKKGGSFEAIIDINDSHISFESGTAASGPNASSTSFSGVDVTLTNPLNGPLTIETFDSTIISAGLGFYLLDRTKPNGVGNTFTGYGQADGHTFGELATSQLASTVGFGASNWFAKADFDFNIFNQYDEQTLYHLSGSLSMYLDENYNVRQGWNLGDASLALSGFTGVHGTPTTDHDVDLNDRLAYGFAWDATDIFLPLYKTLEQNESMLLSYQTRVTSYTRTGCISLNVCLVAYSGFGDPIGRGGGIDSLALRGGDVGAFDIGGPITGVVFDPEDFDPVHNIQTAAIPEPATWLSMIMGFGLLGATLRRRRTALASI